MKWVSRSPKPVRTSRHPSILTFNCVSSFATLHFRFTCFLMAFLCLFPTSFFCSWLAHDGDQHPHLSRHYPNLGIKGAFQTAILIKDDCEQRGRKICREAAHWSSLLFSGEPMSTLPVVELVATPKPAWMSLRTLEQPLSSLALVYGKERKRKPPHVSMFLCLSFVSWLP